MYQAYTEPKPKQQQQQLQKRAKQDHIQTPPRPSSQNVTPGPGTSRYTGGYGSNSEDGNRELFHQLRHNILESINVVCTQFNVTDDEAFEKIFFDWNKDNPIRDKLAETNDNEFTIKDFTQQYAASLLSYNSQYLDLKDARDKLLQTVGTLETVRYQKGKKYHFIDPAVKENVIITSISQAQSLEGEPSVKIYLYIDENFAFKTRAYPKNSNPFINLDIDIVIPSDAKRIVIELYDASEAEGKSQLDDDLSEKSELDDEDKVLHTLIGKTEISIDKVLSNLLVVEEYAALRNIILRSSDEPFSEGEDVFSNHSVARNVKVENEFKNLMQTKGKMLLIFRAELSEDFVDRMEVIKRLYIRDTQDKLQQLMNSIYEKQTIIKQGLDSLYHIQFDPDRGLVLDQLSSMQITSMIDEQSSLMTDSVIIQKNKNQPQENGKDDMRKLKQRNKREIDYLEEQQKNAKNDGAKRMCGCEAFCNTF